MSTSTPLLSIVIPVFDRAGLVRRAIASCLMQEYTDFEVVVVDDGSTDGSAEAAAGAGDARVRVIRHAENRGVCPARNAGADASRGEWIVCLDSDDELIDGALAAIATRLYRLTPGIDGVRFMCRLQTGELSPDPPLRAEVWDYVGYVRWCETVASRRQESLPCVRRSTFARVRYPNSRMLEGIYHLDFAREFRTFAAPEVVRLYHLDAPDRLTRTNSARDRAMAADLADGFEQILDRHGQALQEFAPKVFAQCQRTLATYALLAGERRRGLAMLARSLRAQPLSPVLWAIGVAGLLGPSPLGAIRAARRH